MSTEAKPAAAATASVALTLGFEIAGLQLTPAFKIGSVQIRPTSNVVSLQLSGGAKDALPANISFEIAAVKLIGAQIASWSLKPMGIAKPAPAPQSSLTVGGVAVTTDAAPISVTSAAAGATAIQFVATGHIGGIDFTPTFEIGMLRLDSDSNSALLKLANPAGSAMALPPSFDIAKVETSAEGQITLITLTPGKSA